MNYYSHHIGDYTADAAHLSMLEDGAYRRLMDRYYTTEAPLPYDWRVVCRLVRAHTTEECDAVVAVLSEFFDLAEDGWHHKRCDAEISAYKAKAEANRVNGVKGGRPRKAEIEPTNNPQKTQVVSENNPQKTLTKNQEPITNNQEPLKTKAETQRATRLPADWMPSYADARFCDDERPDLKIDQVAAQFRDYWIAQPGAKGRKHDWSATWRNWVRNQRAPQARASPGYQTPNDKAKALADRLTGRARHEQSSLIIDIE